MSFFLSRCVRTAWLGLSIWLAACSVATDSLQRWGREEDDQVSAFLVTDRGQDLVVIGQRYHYVLSPLEPAMLWVLAHEKRAQFAIANSSVRLSRQGELSGFFVVAVAPESLSEADKLLLAEQGFREAKGQWERIFTLHGRAYQPKGELQGLPSVLKKPYPIHVYKQDSRWRQAVKLPLTPVAFTVDAGLNLAGAALLIPSAFVLCTYHAVQGSSGGICGGSL